MYYICQFCFIYLFEMVLMMFICKVNQDKQPEKHSPLQTRK